MLLTKKKQTGLNVSNAVSEKSDKTSKKNNFDGEFGKECLLAVTVILRPEKIGMFDKIVFSGRKITRRMEEIAADIEGTLAEKKLENSVLSHRLLSKVLIYPIWPD